VTEAMTTPFASSCGGRRLTMTDVEEARRRETLHQGLDGQVIREGRITISVLRECIEYDE